jgi:16S rRNA (guanine527-N7)-methyltransferase
MFHVEPGPGAIAPPPPLAAATAFPEALGRLTRYADLLAGPGTRRGLIGPREMPRLWHRHLLNCAVVETAVPPGSRVVDIGSGAGLPGIVLALVRPDLHLLLLDSLQRRVSFLRVVVTELALDNADVVHGRAEELAPLGCEVATSRAVASLPQVARWSVRHLRPGGVVLALKGAAAHDELAAAAGALGRLGLPGGEVLELGAGITDEPTRVVRLRYRGTARGSGPTGRQRTGRR